MFHLFCQLLWIFCYEFLCLTKQLLDFRACLKIILCHGTIIDTNVKVNYKTKVLLFIIFVLFNFNLKHFIVRLKFELQNNMIYLYNISLCLYKSHPPSLEFLSKIKAKYSWLRFGRRKRIIHFTLRYPKYIYFIATNYFWDI